MKNIFRFIAVTLFSFAFAHSAFAGPIEENRTANFGFSFEVAGDLQPAPTSVSMKDLIPGKSYRGVLVIENQDEVEAEYEIQIHDGIIDDKGEFVFSRIFKDDEGAFDSWVQFDKTQEIIVKGLGTTVKVPFEIKIPVGSSPGDYISHITVVLKGFSSDGVSSSKGGGDTGGSKVGVAVGKGGSMTFNVSGDVFYNLLINSVNWGVKTGQGYYLDLGLHNESNVSVRSVTFVDVKDQEGQSIYSEKFINDKPIFPSAQTTPSVHLANLKELPYGKYAVNTEIYYLSEYDFIKLSDEIKEDKVDKESLTMSGNATFSVWILPFEVIYTGIGLTVFGLITYLLWYYFRRMKKTTK